MGHLSCSERVQLNDLKSMKTPERTETHVPIPHSVAVGEVLDQLDALGYEYDNLEIGVSHEQQRAYWLMDLTSDHIAKDWKSCLGGWNSHDKIFPYSLFAGLNVNICSNTLATGEVKVKTKHTSKVLDRLPRMVTRALYKINQHNIINKERVTKYKDFELPKEDYEFVEIPEDRKAQFPFKQEEQKVFKSTAFIHDFVVRSMDSGVISPSSIKIVLDEWRQPRYEEFAPRNAWSLSNAYTEAFKKYSNPMQLFERGAKITSAIDQLVGYEAPELEEMPEDEEIIVN